MRRWARSRPSSGTKFSTQSSSTCTAPDFVELNQLLRDLVRATDDARYDEIPSERDANRAAANYAAEQFPDDLEALADDERFLQYTGEMAAV